MSSIFELFGAFGANRKKLTNFSQMKPCLQKKIRLADLKNLSNLPAEAILYLSSITRLRGHSSGEMKKA